MEFSLLYFKLKFSTTAMLEYVCLHMHIVVNYFRVLNWCECNAIWMANGFFGLSIVVLNSIYALNCT